MYHIDALGNGGWVTADGSPTDASAGWSGGPPYWRAGGLWRNSHGAVTFPLSAGGWSAGSGRRYVSLPGVSFAPGASLPLHFYQSIAVDPSVIPLDSRVYIPAYRHDGHGGWFIAQDTGGAITGRHIDAREAAECHLVERVVALIDLDHAVEQWVTAILSAGPLAIRAIRVELAFMRHCEGATSQGIGPAAERAEAQAETLLVAVRQFLVAQVDHLVPEQGMTNLLELVRSNRCRIDAAYLHTHRRRQRPRFDMPVSGRVVVELACRMKSHACHLRACTRA